MGWAEFFWDHVNAGCEPSTLHPLTTEMQIRKDYTWYEALLLKQNLTALKSKALAWRSCWEKKKCNKAKIFPYNLCLKSPHNDILQKESLFLWSSNPFLGLICNTRPSCPCVICGQQQRHVHESLMASSLGSVPANNQLPHWKNSTDMLPQKYQDTILEGLDLQSTK